MQGENSCIYKEIKSTSIFWEIAMIHKSRNGLHWLEFELLAPFNSLKHSVFLRHGGESQGVYSSLNLSASKGDSGKCVSANINKIKNVLSVDHIAAVNQVHGDQIKEVNPNNYSSLDSHDGLMTEYSNIGLMVTHADCQAAIFYDPIQHALALVHCGWRGQVLNIYSKVIEKMKAKFFSKPENIHVAISPSLGPKNAEFIHYRTEFPESFWQFQESPNYFNLWAIGLWQLSQAKILPAHVQCAELCTYANTIDFFSYRRTKGPTGLHGTVALLR